MKNPVFLPVKMVDNEALLSENQWACEGAAFTPATDEGEATFYPLIYPEGYLPPVQWCRLYDHATMATEYYYFDTVTLIDLCDMSETDVTATVIDAMASNIWRDDLLTIWESISFSGLTGFATTEGRMYRLRFELSASGQTWYSEKWQAVEYSESLSNYRIPDLIGNIRTSDPTTPDLRIHNE